MISGSFEDAFYLHEGGNAERILLHVAHLGTVPLQPGVVHFRKILAVEEHLAFGGAMQAQDRLH
ncbi:MAG: hypothetical protein R2856_28770 [Caldilineaceae bacterium]